MKHVCFATATIAAIKINILLASKVRNIAPWNLDIVYGCGRIRTPSRFFLNVSVLCILPEIERHFDGAAVERLICRDEIGPIR